MLFYLFFIFVLDNALNVSTKLKIKERTQQLSYSNLIDWELTSYYILTKKTKITTKTKNTTLSAQAQNPPKSHRDILKLSTQN